MTPKGFGTASGGCESRGIPTCVVEDVIKNGKLSEVVRDGIVRSIYENNGIKVITEESGKIVISVIPC